MKRKKHNCTSLIAVVILIIGILLIGGKHYVKKHTAVQTGTSTEGHADSRNTGNDSTGAASRVSTENGSVTEVKPQATADERANDEAVPQATYDTTTTISSYCKFAYSYSANGRPGYVDNVNLTPNRVYYNASQLEKGLLYGLVPYAEDFIRAQYKYGIDAVFLAAIAAEESGYGRYTFKPNNIFGLTNCTFDSVPDCIDYAAGYLRKTYLTPGGTYYNGCSVADVNTKYNGRKSWEDNITRLMAEITTRVEANSDYVGP